MSQSEITVTIPGKPVAKGRHRTSQAKLGFDRAGKPYVIQGHPFTPKTTREWEKAAKWYIKSSFQGGGPIMGAIALSAVIVFEVPVSWPKWKREAALEGVIVPTAKPDLDNVIKAIKDAVNDLGWQDDSYVTRSSEVKQYGKNAGIFLRINKIPGVIPSQITSKAEFLLLTTGEEA